MAKLAEDPPPPMPNFDGLDEMAEGDPQAMMGDDRFADDDIFGGTSKEPVGMDTYMEVQQVDPLPSIDERSATCKDWRSQYGAQRPSEWLRAR